MEKISWKKPGYGYDTEKEFVLPEIRQISKGTGLFFIGEKGCIRVLKALNSLVEANQFKVYDSLGEGKDPGSRAWKM